MPSIIIGNVNTVALEAGGKRSDFISVKNDSKFPLKIREMIIEYPEGEGGALVTIDAPALGDKMCQKTPLAIIGYESGNVPRVVRLAPFDLGTTSEIKLSMELAGPVGFEIGTLRVGFVGDY